MSAPVDLQRRMLEAIQSATADSEWAPSEGGLVTEAVVIMGWVAADGDNGMSYLCCGTSWGTEGLVVQALRQIEAADDYEVED